MRYCLTGISTSPPANRGRKSCRSRQRMSRLRYHLCGNVENRGQLSVEGKDGQEQCRFWEVGLIVEDSKPPRIALPLSCGSPTMETARKSTAG
jgi:hypothetical protein